MNILVELIGSKIVLICLSTWVLCQVLKLTLHALHTKHPSLWVLLTSGGMPSSHAAVVSAFAAAVYLSQGFSLLFLTAGMLASITLYDAVAFRQQLGIQAKAINALTKKKFNLKENLGHRPSEVLAGIIIGIALGLLLY